MANIIGVTGSMGRLQESATSIIARMIKRSIESNGGSIKLFSNYELPGATRMQHVDDWMMIAQAKGSVCAWSPDTYNQTWVMGNLAYARVFNSIQLLDMPSIDKVGDRIKYMLDMVIDVTPVSQGLRLDYYDYESYPYDEDGCYLRSRFLPGHIIEQMGDQLCHIS